MMDEANRIDPAELGLSKDLAEEKALRDAVKADLAELKRLSQPTPTEQREERQRRDAEARRTLRRTGVVGGVPAGQMRVRAIGRGRR